jgi:hypothetical protein
MYNVHLILHITPEHLLINNNCEIFHYQLYETNLKIRKLKLPRQEFV